MPHPLSAQLITTHVSSCIGRRCLVAAAPWRPRQRLRGQAVHADTPESRGDHQQLGSWLNRARHRPRCVVLLLIFVRVLPLLDKTEDAPCRGTMFGCFCVPSLCRRSYMCISTSYAHDDVIDDGRTKSVCSLLRVPATPSRSWRHPTMRSRTTTSDYVCAMSKSECGVRYECGRCPY